MAALLQLSRHSLAVLLIFSALIIASTLAESNGGNNNNKRSKFGEFCNKTMKCYKGAWLECKNGICDCFRAEEMMYDSGKEKCVSKAGERCRFELNSDMALVEQTECVVQAKCGNDGICACDKFFYEALNGSCAAQGLVGQSCDLDQSCRSDKFLDCIEGICSCNQTVSEYSQSDGHCVGLGSLPCLGEKCTPNAICTGQKICSCSPSDEYFQNSSSRKCEIKKGLKESCENDVECKSKNIFLKCGSVSGICECDPSISNYELAPYFIQEKYQAVESYEELEEYQVQEYAYDSRYGYNRNMMVTKTRPITKQRPVTKIRDILKYRHECVGLAEKRCNPNANCVKNSECSYGTCECNDGFSSTSNGFCGNDYGVACDAVSVCSDDFTCSLGKCACKDPLHQIHVARTPTSKSKCYGIVAGRCSSTSDCIPNALCKFSDKNNNASAARSGRCQCDDSGSPKFVENAEGHCELAFKSPCTYGSSGSAVVECDQLAGLQCRNELCTCPEESMVFDHENRMCLQVVGARCSEESQCVPSAVCMKKRTGLSGVCTCPDGLVETAEGECGEILNESPEPEKFTNEKLGLTGKSTTEESQDLLQEIDRKFESVTSAIDNDVQNQVDSNSNGKDPGISYLK